MNKQVPIKEGLWSFSNGRMFLIGSMCTRCGEVFFPRKADGFCSHCYNERMEDVRLSDTGRIITFTVVYQQPAGGFYKGPVPYAYGVVQLPEGVNVQTLFTGCDLEAIKTGLEAKLTLCTLFKETDGSEIVSYAFEPIIDKNE